MSRFICLAFLLWQFSVIKSQSEIQIECDVHVIILQSGSAMSGNVSIFSGALSKGQTQEVQPVLGSVNYDKGSVKFSPLVPLAYNSYYTIVYGEEILHCRIELPEDYLFLEIERIYPSQKKLPSNLLKWYIQFSKPISTANIYNNIHLLNAKSDTVDRAILRLENALLSEDEKLLTVWIEPGRQKRDLGPNVELGPVFQEDSTYYLVVTPGIRDNMGISMKEEFKHKFTIGEPDRQKLELSNWKILAPGANTSTYLEIDCREALDYGSMLEKISIINSSGNQVDGEWSITENETVLKFIPKSIWKPGYYTLHFDLTIEDLAGNNFERLFDATLKDDQLAKMKKPHLDIKFLVK